MWNKRMYVNTAVKSKYLSCTFECIFYVNIKFLCNDWTFIIRPWSYWRRGGAIRVKVALCYTNIITKNCNSLWEIRTKVWFVDFVQQLILLYSSIHCWPFEGAASADPPSPASHSASITGAFMIFCLFKKLIFTEHLGFPGLSAAAVSVFLPSLSISGCSAFDPGGAKKTMCLINWGITLAFSTYCLSHLIRPFILNLE